MVTPLSYSRLVDSIVLFIFLKFLLKRHTLLSVFTLLIYIIQKISHNYYPAITTIQLPQFMLKITRIRFFGL